ncbi:YceI family protein [Flavobacterium sp.]|jgi:polyisoprenoid-binding protein YceI|uniref:YceI family protein n=1 Tax=Flavobacterium sp. TaxID=239 RepID=UPI0037BF18E5
MATTKWTIDPTHSEVGFKVKHMMFTNVSGQFDTYDATITTEDFDFLTSKIEFSADIDSINTGNSDRDNHLKSADFFDAEKNPKLTFVSSSLVKKGEDHELTGELTINGITKTVKLDTEVSGLLKDPWGNTKVGLNATGKINRTDFGLTWNSALETGGVLVSEEVKLNIELQFLQQ